MSLVTSRAALIWLIRFFKICKENRKTAKAQKRADNKEKAKDGNESDDTAKSVTFSLGRMGAPVRGGWLGAGGSGGGSSNAAMETEGDGGIC